MSWQKFVWLLLDNADKYFLVAGPAFLVFYILIRKRVSFKKIQSRFPNRSDYWREIGFSVLSIIIFSVPPLVMLYSDTIRPVTTFYEDISEYGWVYAVLAFPLIWDRIMGTLNKQYDQTFEEISSREKKF